MKKHLSPALTLLGVSVLLGTSHAQTMDNNTMPMGTMNTGMMDKSMTTSDADKQFLMDTAQGSVYDQDTAQLAVSKAQSKSVQRYALKLMDDHTRLNKALLMQANKRGLTLPLTISDDDKTKLQTLMDTSAGSDFDMAYLKEAVNINAEDVRKGNDAMNASKDQQFRSLMRDYVNTEQKHLNEASALLAAMQRSSSMMKGGAMNGGTMNGTMNAPATTGAMPTK